MKIRFPFSLKGSTSSSGKSSNYQEMSSQQKSKALERMYHEHHRLLYSYALKLGRSEEAADDLMQDTMLKATKYLHSFDGRNEIAWLKRVMKTCFIDTYQHNKKRHAIRGGTLEYDDRITQQISAHDLNGELQELYRELISNSGTDWRETFKYLITDDLLLGLEGLSKEHRDILIMSHLMDMPYEEIAEELEVPLGTVMSRLYRARNRLGESLADRSTEVAVKIASFTGKRRGTKRGIRAQSSPKDQSKKITQSHKKNLKPTHEGVERVTLSDSGATP